MKHLIITFTGFLVLHVNLYAADTTRIYFKHDDKSIVQNIRLLDSVSRLKNIASIKVLGYTDHLGSNAYNIVLSLQRANNVKYYLSGRLPSEIILAAGKGEIASWKNGVSGEPANRRAEIIISYISLEGDGKQTDKPKSDFNKIAELEVGENLVLNTFHFIGGRHFLLPEYIYQIDTLAKVLRQNPGIHIEIQGFICCIMEGDGLDYDTGEYKLSVNRAKYIYDELVKRKIDKNRLRYTGFGSSRPMIFPEITEDDKTANRRVEIKILSK